MVDTRDIARSHRQRKEWRTVVTALACVVVFCTVYALVMPAITLTGDTYCGKVEHTHTEACYLRELTCGLEEGAPESGSASESGAADGSEGATGGESESVASHVHTDACYETQRVLTCGQEESAGHTHDASCYATESELTCGMEESEGHAHSEECYDEAGELVCGLEESEGHVHSDACYTETSVLVCGQEESEGHTHTDDCYTEVGVLVCAEPTEAAAPEVGEAAGDDAADASAEAAVHHHTDACYASTLVCEQEEHTHTLQCYSNTDAVDTLAEWAGRIPALSGESYASDLVAVAESQLGYAESTANFKVQDDGSTKGYKIGRASCRERV